MHYIKKEKSDRYDYLANVEVAKEILPVAKVECEEFSLDHVKIGKENKKLVIFVFAKIKDPVYTQEDNRKYLFESEIYDERYKNQTFIFNKCLTRKPVGFMQSCCFVFVGILSTYK